MFFMLSKMFQEFQVRVNHDKDRSHDRQEIPVDHQNVSTQVSFTLSDLCRLAWIGTLADQCIHSLPHNLNFWHTWGKKKTFENIVGKGENAGNQHLLLFPQWFLSYYGQIHNLSNLRNPDFQQPKEEGFWKQGKKRRNHNFFQGEISLFELSVTLIFLSANAYNLDQSKV